MVVHLNYTDTPNPN